MLPQQSESPPSAPTPRSVPGSANGPMLLWSILALTCAAPAAGGCQFRWGWGLLVLASALLLVWHASRNVRRTAFWAPFSWVFAALVALHVIQLIPLPPAL